MFIRVLTLLFMKGLCSYNYKIFIATKTLLFSVALPLYMEFDQEADSWEDVWSMDGENWPDGWYQDIKDEPIRRITESLINSYEDISEEIWTEIDENVGRHIVESNSFWEPFDEGQFEWIRDNMFYYGDNIDTHIESREEVELMGRRIIFTVSKRNGFEQRTSSFVSFVWHDDYFDEVVSVPDELQAVDLHDAYQFGEHLEYGSDYIICRYEDDVVRIDY